jgi:hypothetical protein
MTQAKRVKSNFTPMISAAVVDEYFTDNEYSVVGFDPRTGEIHRLNQSASAIWSLIDGKSSVGEIAGDVAEIFGLRSSAAAKSVKASIEEFRNLGLLEGGALTDSLDARAVAEAPPVLPRVADP